MMGSRERVVKNWSKLLREAVMAPSLSVLKKACGKQRHGFTFRWPVWSQQLDSMILATPFQLRIFYNSMIQ